MIDPTVWGAIILKITAEQRYFLKKEFGITEVDLRLQSLQDVSELINGLASIAFMNSIMSTSALRGLIALSTLSGC